VKPWLVGDAEEDGGGDDGAEGDDGEHVERGVATGGLAMECLGHVLIATHEVGDLGGVTAAALFERGDLGLLVDDGGFQLAAGGSKEEGAERGGIEHGEEAVDG